MEVPVIGTRVTPQIREAGAEIEVPAAGIELIRDAHGLRLGKEISGIEHACSERPEGPGVVRARDDDLAERPLPDRLAQLGHPALAVHDRFPLSEALTGGPESQNDQ